MADTLLKTKILEKYDSINLFCFANEINSGTLRPYCSGKRNVDTMSLKTLNKICDGLDCAPSDIGYTKEHWYKVCSKNKSTIVEPPSFLKKES